MKTRLLQVVSLIGLATVITNVMAHGDHSSVTAEHGLEHFFYYGIGIVVGLGLLRLGRKLSKQRNSK